MSSNETTMIAKSSFITAAKQLDNTLIRESPFIDPRIVQNFLLIWLDLTIDESTNDYCNSIIQLRRIVNTIKTFNDVDQCADFLTDLHHEKAFMIVSSTLAQNILPLIHGVSQLDSIYILCEQKSMYEDWEKRWSKVGGVFTHIPLICEALKMTARKCDQNSISISIIPSIDTSNQTLDQLDQSFMYTQLIKESLLEIEYEEQSIKEFAVYCREGNYSELNAVNKFEQEYYSQSPIWWYTYAGFLYHMLNRALRTQEVDTIIKMGFFIHDLHRHIQQLFSAQSTREDSRPFIVYRGQGMIIEDFEKMRKNQGSLLSFNNFLSTSSDRNVSFIFADSNRFNSELIGILFQITVNPLVSSTPFALLNDVSYYSESEAEVLFSMHTVFRIGEMKKIDDDDRLWQVELVLTSDDDQQLRALTDSMREEFCGATGWYRLGILLLKLGEFDKGEQMYQTLLGRRSNDTEKAHLNAQLGFIKQMVNDYQEALLCFNKSLEIEQQISPINHLKTANYYNSIGSVYHKMGKHLEAISFYKKALGIFEEFLPQNHSYLAGSYNNIGTVYAAKGMHSEALIFYEKALKVLQTILPPYHPDLATSYNNIGLLYSKLGEYSKALLFHEKSLEICERIFPSNHPDFGSSYNNIGLVYQKIGEYSKALSFYEKALKIEQSRLPAYHQILATCYNNIASVYLEMGDYLKVLPLYEKALEIDQLTLPLYHPDFIISYNNIGLVHSNLGDYSKALFYYEKALENSQKAYSTYHPTLAIAYSNIASVYADMNEFSKALSFYEEALQIEQKASSSTNPELVTTYNKIGSIHEKMGEYAKASSFYEKALEIAQSVLSLDHPNLATTYNNIGSLCLNMGEHSKALLLFEKALEIQQKKLLPTHLDLATSHNNIASVCFIMQDYPKAILFFESAIKIASHSLPPTHPDLQMFKNNLEFITNLIRQE